MFNHGRFWTGRSCAHSLDPQVTFRVVTLVIFLQSAAPACGPTAPSTLRTVPPGLWGGDHARLTISSTDATIEFDCAHGRVDAPLAVNRNGRFDVGGIFVREHGGPIRVDETLEQEPARYTGTTDGRTMSLMVTSSEPLGTFTLVLGQEGRVMKCL